MRDVGTVFAAHGEFLYKFILNLVPTKKKSEPIMFIVFINNFDENDNIVFSENNFIQAALSFHIFFRFVELDFL